MMVSVLPDCKMFKKRDALWRSSSYTTPLATLKIISLKDLAKGPIKCINLVTEYFFHSLYFKAYEANRDSLFLKTQNTSFYARFVRIIPTKWHDAICMKAQLKGCPGLHFLSYSIHGKKYS